MKNRTWEKLIFDSDTVFGNIFKAKWRLFVQDGAKILDSYTMAVAKKRGFLFYVKWLIWIDPSKLDKAIHAESEPINPNEKDIYYSTVDNNYYIALS